MVGWCKIRTLSQARKAWRAHYCMESGRHTRLDCGGTIVKRINTRRIKSKISYPVATLAEVVGVHPNTVNNWVKNEGLQRVHGVYPYLIYGQAAIEFLNARQQKNKSTLLPDEFRCCTCQAPRKAWEGIATIQTLTTKRALLRAVCESCNGKICKFFSLKNKAAIEETFQIQQLLPSALVQSTNTNPNSETKGV